MIEDSDEDIPDSSLKKTIALPPFVAGVIGADKVERVIAALSPLPGDDMVEKALTLDERGEAHEPAARRGSWARRVEPEVGSKAHFDSEDSIAHVRTVQFTKRYPGVPLIIGCKVRTPFGKGLLLELGPGGKGPYKVGQTSTTTHMYLHAYRCTISYQ